MDTSYVLLRHPFLRSWSRRLGYRCLSQEATQIKKKPPVARERINIGTIGHVDHGKTTLTSALTKICSQINKNSKFTSFDDIDKAKEEKIRGVTINASHIGYSTLKRDYAHTDCPGHADYIKNMICGTSQMDAAILVVAGSEGQMPQTKEHVLLSKQVGLKQMIVYVNKCDIVDEEMKTLVEMEVRDLLNHHGFDGDNAPFVFGSALAALEGDTSHLGEGSVKQLLNIMDNNVKLPERDTSGPFYMFFDSKMSIQGRGTVVIGTISRGVINRGDPVEIVGRSEVIKTTATDIQMFKKSMLSASAGDHVGILIRGVKVEQLERGMVMCKPSTWNMFNRIEASIYLFSEEESGKKTPISKHYVQPFYTETWSLGARIDVPREAGGMILPGDHGTVHITLARAMPFVVGQRFTIRQHSKTVATGVVTKLLPSMENAEKYLIGKAKEPAGFEYGLPEEEGSSKKSK